jgi:NADH-quinone oxidoreductase subunit J
MFIEILFAMSAILTLGGATGVVISKNIMHACIYLLASLIGIAGLYATLGADFVAVTQIMVYVGGVVILMLFAIMLTGGKDFASRAQKLLGLIPNMGNAWSYSIASLVAIVFALMGLKLFKSINASVTVNPNTPFESTVDKIGFSLITDHVLAFEISSVLLLGALVGAAIIARPRRG